MTPPPRVKICGLMRRDDALAAAQVGADYLGVIMSEGFGRSMSGQDAAAIVEGIDVSKVAVLVDESVERSVEAGRAIGAEVLQLHGRESVETVRALRDAGGFRLWKALRARSVEDVHDTVRHYRPFVDGFLVEGWREGAIGGAGLTLEVDAAGVRAAIPDDSDFVLAGGLTPESVADAVARFRPDVVDVSSGVEREVGVKDHGRLSAFVQHARALFPFDSPGQPGRDS